MSIRDTQFKGFAKALLKEIVDDMLDEYGFMERSHYECGDLNTAEELIARRAFDFAVHIVRHANVCGDDLKNKFWTDGEIVEDIPDMPELPDDDKRYAEMQQEEQE